MKSEHILEAMTYINDNYIAAAEKRLGYLTPLQHRKTGAVYSLRIFKRAAALAAAVILVLSVSFLTAMTVSAQFREMVFRFFQIEQQEIVPEPSINTEITNDNMYTEPARMNTCSIIEGTYVHLPSASYAQDGVYLICTDEPETRRSSHYDAYYEHNGEFVKLEENTFRQDYTILGKHFHVEFDWAAYNKTAVQTYEDPDALYRKPHFSGDINAALFLFQCEIPSENETYTTIEYPVIINLETGELTDILAGITTENIPHIGNAAISDDLSKMLLAASDGTLYYMDLTANKLYNIDNLSGEHTDACSLIGNTLACWVQENGYRAWTIDLATFERKELFDPIADGMSAETFVSGIQFIAGFDTWIRNGSMYAGSCFALETDTAGNVFVIDLANGAKLQIEGFVWPSERYSDIQRIPSPDGKKLLLCGGYTGFNYQYIGVLDFENMSYMEFSRENSTDIQEHSAYWFDEKNVIIRTTATEFSHDYYVYSIPDAYPIP